MSAIHPIVLGTAGHIDHGKTSLVHALTGIDTDRLAVEKQRGITTELGFARLDLGDRRIAIVDVPGHERFVKSMVAGATGLDLVCLCIAADEGIMPQTREHLDIIQLLGLRRGVVALTKVDLVDDPEWLALVSTEIRAALAAAGLVANIVPVSVRRPETLDALRAEIAALVDALPVRSHASAFRLPIDRVFTMKGFGTVVTGTMLGGEVAIGDELTVIPSNLTTRVRGIEVHGSAVEKARAGSRVALNLGNIAVDDLARGDMLAHPGRVAASHILDVEIAWLDPARQPRKAIVHHAASATLATIVPTGPGLAQLRLDARTPIGALPGDRFILRDGGTIGGGSIVRVLAPKARGDHATIVAELLAARAADRAALEIKAASFAGLSHDDLARHLGEVPDLAALVASGELLDVAPHYLHATAVAQIEAKLVANTKLPPSIPPRALDAIRDGLAKRTAKPTIQLSPADQALDAQFRAWGVEPLRPKEIPDAKSLERLLAAKRLVKIKPDLVMHADTVADVRARLIAHLDQHATIDATQWKALTGASRKFTIPLAEYFDAEKLTLRIGDLRRKR